MASVCLTLNSPLLAARPTRAQVAPRRTRMPLRVAAVLATRPGSKTLSPYDYSAPVPDQGLHLLATTPDDFDLAYYNMASSTGGFGGGKLQLFAPYIPISNDADLQDIMSIRPSYAVVKNGIGSGPSDRYTGVYYGMLADLYIPEYSEDTDWAKMLKKANQWGDWQAFKAEASGVTPAPSEADLLKKFTQVSQGPSQHAAGWHGRVCLSACMPWLVTIGVVATAGGVTTAANASSALSVQTKQAGGVVATNRSIRQLMHLSALVCSFLHVGASLAHCWDNGRASALLLQNPCSTRVCIYPD